VSSPLAGGVVAILRGRRAEHLDTVLDVLVDAGIRSLEVTLNTPGALEAIRRARTRFGEEVSVGAGTVRTVADVEDAVAAGAQFLVSPHTDPALGARARELSAAYLPGALTPTEIVTAWNSGAAAVKLFPARLGGPRYLRDLREPLRTSNLRTSTSRAASTQTRRRDSISWSTRSIVITPRAESTAYEVAFTQVG